MAFVESLVTLENVKLAGKKEEPQTLASQKGPAKASLVSKWALWVFALDVKLNRSSKGRARPLFGVFSIIHLYSLTISFETPKCKKFWGTSKFILCDRAPTS